MLAFSDTRFNLATSGEVRYVDGLWVSGNYFEYIGVAPVAGTADRHRPTTRPAAPGSR